MSVRLKGFETSEWLEFVPRLPKGHRWSDGRKFQVKAGKKNDAEKYTFLPIENDLYIKDLFNNTYVKDNRIFKIVDWKKLYANDVIMVFDVLMTPLLETAILTVWHENNVPLGYSRSFLRDL